MPPAPPAVTRRPLVSRTSILILSGVLIGFGLQFPLSVQVHESILGAGLVGLISFLGLESVANTRAEAAKRLARERLQWMMQSRIHKHIPRIRPHAIVPASVSLEDSSFLTVTKRRK